MESDNSQVVVRTTHERWKSWSETTFPNPSLGNFYRVFEWIAAHDATTNYHVLAFFLALLSIICCLVASWKHITRASTRWHVSPLAVALILLHLASDIELETLAETFSQTSSWNSIKSYISLIDPFHGLRRYRGPAAYTLIILAVWETLVFALSPLVLSRLHPNSRNNAEWTFYAAMMALTSISVVPQVDLPLIRRSRKYMSIQETYESTESFIKTVVLLTAVFMLFTAVFALILDSVLFEGCILDSITGRLEVKTPASPEHKSIATETREISIPVIVQLPEKASNLDIDIAAHVESYLWKQMCIVKEQTQVIEALSISERDDLSIAYSKLGGSYAALLPVRPVLDGLIAVLHSRAQRIDHFQRHLAAVDEALRKIQAQMYNLIFEQNDVNFVRSAPGQDVEGYVETLNRDNERFMHVHLDRQQIKEELMEGEDDMDILQNKMMDVNEDDYPVDFSGQLYTQTAILELHARRLKERRLRNARLHLEGREQSQPRRISTPPLQLKQEPLEEKESVLDESKPLLFSTMGPHNFDSSPTVINIPASPTWSSRKAPSTPARSSSAITDENAELIRIKSPVRKSADHMVVGLWNNAATLEFRSDNFLRGHSPSDILKPDDLLAMGELGRYLILRVRGNRAETAAASKIIINLEKCARSSKDNRTVLNVGVNNLNYFRSCMWLGQARLTKFPPPTQDRVFTEIPIEGLIKLAGYGPDGIKSLNMLPVPKETWAQYLDRLSRSLEIKKVKELHEWLDRYLGGVPTLLGREVPRAEGWDTGVALDANRCLYRHLENMMLLPPYPAEIEKALSIYRIEKTDEKEIDPTFVGSTLVENLLSSPKSNEKASILRFQAL